VAADPGDGARRRARIRGGSHDVADPGRALDEIDELAAEVGEDDLQGRVWLESARLALSMALGAGRDDPVQAEVWAALRGIADRGGAAAAPLGEVFDALRDIMAGPTDPDLAGKVERLRHAAGKLPADSPARATSTMRWRRWRRS